MLAFEQMHLIVIKMCKVEILLILWVNKENFNISIQMALP